ncbi:hypothetical protein [uncultured Ruminococcus sp.]|uniref:hypothetical protein n=1 Tax=uncultured Ruminococcus sp. TaxID=165186 RepID=UPI00292F9E94|nr:hypothetical protein [uncultured Ruminococcus sp.]
MAFNEIYKMYSWNDICEQFEQNVRSSSKAFFKHLAKHDRIQLREDGSVMVDVDNMNPFILYTSEFYYLLHAYTQLVTNDEAIAYPAGEAKLQRKFDELLSVIKVEDLELNADAFYDRADEYERYMQDETLLCSSLPKKCIRSEVGRIAAIFVDFVVADDIQNDYCKREDAIKICEGFEDTNYYANGLYNNALRLHSKIVEQVKPYIDGSLIADRKAKGLCPNCGGYYKGLIVKKCDRCGSKKEK